MPESPAKVYVLVHMRELQKPCFICLIFWAGEAKSIVLSWLGEGLYNPHLLSNCLETREPVKVCSSLQNYVTHVLKPNFP